MTPQILAPDYGAHNAMLDQAIKRLDYAGSYTLSGQDASALASKNSVADAGVYALVGQDAIGVLSQRLVSDAGAGPFTITGLPAYGSSIAIPVKIIKAFALTTSKQVPVINLSYQSISRTYEQNVTLLTNTVAARRARKTTSREF